MQTTEPSIILVRPQLPENIGMVARATHNCGFKKLILVSPREKWPNQRSIDASAKGKVIVKNAKLFQSISAALSSFHYVIATSARKRFLQKPHQNDFSKLFKKIPLHCKIAIVFGPENSGLSNDDLNLCDCVFSISLSRQNQSLNLSHSVLLMIYKWQEYFKRFNKKNNNNIIISKKKDFNFFMIYLKKELTSAGFLFPKEKSKTMFNNIQTMLLRAELSRTEIQTLWGMIKTLIKPRKK